MAHIVYLLCSVASLWCAFTLVRSYFRSRTALLLWSGICFVGLSLNNVFLLWDLILGPNYDLSILRGSLAVASMAVLLYGLIWDTV